jgi:hypothetical protein
MVNIVFIVIATDQKPWGKLLRRGPGSTWFKTLPDNTSVVSIYSDGSLGASHYLDQTRVGIEKRLINSELSELKYPVLIEGQRLVFPGISGWAGILPTTLSALEYVRLNFEYDFIVRTNVSSYWNVRNLITVLDGMPKNDLFMGVVGTANVENDELDFISGAGMIMSRNIVEKIIENRSKIDFSYIDDVALGILARDLELNLTPGVRQDFSRILTLLTRPSFELSKIYHFRLRSEFFYHGIRIRKDAMLMKMLHFKLRLTRQW